MSTILVIGAHPDDEVYGCGATIHRLVQQGAVAHALILSEGCSSQYPGNREIAQQKVAESQKASQLLGYSSYHNAGLPDMRLDGVEHITINGIIEATIAELKPEIIFTHHPGDINLDHRRVCESTMVACRPGSGVGEIRHYETPSSTEWGSGFEPNLFYRIDEVSLRAKIEAIECYQSEIRTPPHPRSVKKVKAWAAYRGCAAGSDYAEVFSISKKWC